MWRTTEDSTCITIEEASTSLRASDNARVIVGVASFVYAPFAGSGFEATGAAVSIVKLQL